ncbi:MAG: FAD-dependent thymidylate synthase [Clostridiales bacterium]|nr:FAD-dependent thymidylate synthase [Clostridiales bacterium]
MKVRYSSYEILDELNGMEILKKIERIGRVCYKSEDKITKDSCIRFVKNLIDCGHEAMLEHYSFSVKFIVDRGISHEIVRHRLASFAQESTRFCNYANGKEVEFIIPYNYPEKKVVDCDYWARWTEAMEKAEKTYLSMVKGGFSPQKARAVLPNSLKTELVMTANLREWRHFLKLRAVGTTGKPHPQMLEVTLPLLDELKEKIPVVFDDLGV